MNASPLPSPLFHLISASLCTSALTLIFAALIISVSPVFWIIPASFIATFGCHAIFLLIANSESAGSLRVFSAINVGATYLLSAAWTSTFGVALAYTILLWTGRVDKEEMEGRAWTMVVLCVLALLEVVIMGFVAAASHKERKRVLYKEKWKWRPGASPSNSQWSIGQQS
ncbi:hypothetical protein BDQ12DRAFT_717393 [Crucibulum laeve]|uniref:MARVEL domain-containing protein n=1 Tax=Crucibulum laeve TaxID=68775 RepID=A0A5C3MIN4_9AGAR|nr:hypothetical protein BDQ12DRAFT_717393 [Crucibulum laeve]